MMWAINCHLHRKNWSHIDGALKFMGEPGADGTSGSHHMVQLVKKPQPYAHSQTCTPSSKLDASLRTTNSTCRFLLLLLISESWLGLDYVKMGTDKMPSWRNFWQLLEPFLCDEHFHMLWLARRKVEGAKTNTPPKTKLLILDDLEPIPAV